MSSVKPAEKSLVEVRALHYIKLQGLPHLIDSVGMLSTVECKVTYLGDVWLSYYSNGKFVEAGEETTPIEKKGTGHRKTPTIFFRKLYSTN